MASGGIRKQSHVAVGELCAAPPKQAWRRRLNSHADRLKEFSVTFTEAVKMVFTEWLPLCLLSQIRLGLRLWSYVREEASQGRKAPIDPFTRESCKPSASQGVPLEVVAYQEASEGNSGTGKLFRDYVNHLPSRPINFL
ncbi:hypothetical protein ACLOJK_007963 [Asimina triloba]